MTRIFAALFLIFFLTLESLQVHAQINVEYYMNKGIGEYNRNDYTLAIQTFNALIRARPELPYPHIYRGLSKFNLGDFRGADFDFTRAITLDPYNPDAYHFRGAVKSNMFDYYSALEDFKKSIERSPNNPFVYRSRGITLMKLQDYAGAVISLDTAILINPSEEDFYYIRAIAKSRLEDYNGAIEDCNRAIKLNFFNKDAFIERGKFKNEINDYEGAMKDFDQAIKIDEKNPLVYYYRAFTRIKSGDTTAALNDYNKVIQLDPRNDITYYNRAMIWLQRKEFLKALDDLDHVLRINPENIYTWYNRGDTKIQLKDYNGAIEDFTEAINLFPDFAAAYMRRSYAKQESGNDLGAREDYELAIGIINAVNSGQDFGLINRRYTADSTYMKKMIEFEADFNSDNVTGGRIQNRQILVRLLPNFNIQYFATDSVIAWQRETGYHYPALDKFIYNNQNFSLGISSQHHSLKENDIQFLSGKADSVLYYDPFNWQNYFWMGTINAMLMNYGEAKISFDRAIELNPNYIEAYFNRANVNFELAEHQFSIEESTPQITISMGGATNTTVEPEKRIPDFSGVLKDYDRVVQLDYNMSFAYYNRGNIKNRTRDFEGAVQDYTVAVAIDPNFAEAFYNRAITLIYLKNTKDACLDLSRAGELGVQEAYSVIKRYCNK